MKNWTCTIFALALLALALTAGKSLAQSTYEPYTFITLAGLSPGSADGTGSDARFNFPYGLAVDSAGNVYVADSLNTTIRKGYPALAISNLLYSTNGQFSFNLTGPAGQLAVVEMSTDLVTWLSIWTNTFGTNAISDILNLSDPQSGVSSKRFCRVHTP